MGKVSLLAKCNDKCLGWGWFVSPMWDGEEFLCRIERREGKRPEKWRKESWEEAEVMCLGYVRGLEYLPPSIISSILLSSWKNLCLCIICGTWWKHWALCLLWLGATQSSKWRKWSEVERNHAEALWCHRLWNSASGQGCSDFPGMGSPSWHPYCTNPFQNTSSSLQVLFWVQYELDTKSRGEQHSVFRMGQVLTKLDHLPLILGKPVVARPSYLCALFRAPIPLFLVKCIHLVYSSSNFIPKEPCHFSSPPLSQPYFERFYWPNCIYSQFNHFPIVWQWNAM